eukprot:1304810-Ditylum_brightwellii.AAC.1
MLAINSKLHLKGTAKQLQEKAHTMEILVTVDEEKVKEGWLGKAKGMKQVAYKGGFINVSNFKLYTKDGPKDDDGKIIDKSFSLKSIVGSFTDFVEEETLLQ